MTEMILTLIVAAMFSVVGVEYGKGALCKDQFHGEMHEGKCVKVQREEVK